MSKILEWHELVIKHRTELDLSLRQVGEMIGSTHAVPYFIEMGKYTAPSIGTFLRLQKVLKIPDDEFLKSLRKTYVTDEVPKVRSRPRRRSGRNVYWPEPGKKAGSKGKGARRSRRKDASQAEGTPKGEAATPVRTRRAGNGVKTRRASTGGA